MTDNVVEVVIRATDSASSTIEGVGGAFGKIGGIALGVAAAAATAGVAIAGFTTHMVEGIEAVNDAATRLGITAEKLSELHFAADLANISSEQLDASLAILQRTAAEAAENGGKVAQSLSRMGISAKDFSALPVDQKLGVLADRLEGVQDAGQRARIATELFGRSGMQMLQVLKNGSDGLAKAAEEARKFGVAIGPQQAANAKEFGDMMDRVGAASTGLGRAITSDLIPIITGLGNRFANFIAANREAVGQWVHDTIRNFVAFAIMTEQVFTKVKTYILGVFDTGGLGKLVGDFVTIVGWAFNKVLELARIVASRVFEYWALSFQAIPKFLYELFKTAFLTVLDLAVTVGKRLWDALKGNVPKTGWFDDLGEVLSRSVNQVVEDARPAFEGFSDIGKGLLSDLGDFGKQTGGEVKNALSGAFDLDIGKSLEQADQLLNTWSQFGEVTKENNAKAAEFVPGFWDTLNAAAEDWLAKHKTAVEEIANSTFDLMMNTAGAIGDTFAQAIVSGQSLGKSLQSLLKNVASSIISMLIRVGVERLLLSVLTKKANASDASSSAAAAVGLAGANMVASFAAAPWPIDLGALAMGPVAVAAAAGAYSAGAAAGAALGASTAAHGGMEFVPSESTYLLQRGERVLSPQQNTDLTAFLGGGSAAQQSRTVNINFDEDLVTDGRGIRKLLRAMSDQLRLSGIELFANGVIL